MMLYYQSKFGCKPIRSLEDTTEIAVFWLYKPLLWPWHWTQWTNFSAWHSGLWCCTTIPGLATKCSVILKILSRQTFTNILNLHCDLDLESSITIFQQDSLAYELYYQTRSGCKWTSSSEDIAKIVIFWLYIYALAVTLTLKIVNLFFYMTNCLVIIHHHTKFGKKRVERFRRYWVDTIRQTDRTTEGWTKWFQYPLPPPTIYTEGDIKRKKHMESLHITSSNAVCIWLCVLLSASAAKLKGSTLTTK